MEICAQLLAQSGVCACVCPAHLRQCLFVCIYVCVRYSFVVQYALLCCVHYLHVCSAESKYVCVCTPVLCAYMCPCVFIECCWLQILMEREREGWRQRIKTNEVQSSEADDCVFVGLNLFITDARKISIETILVTDSPCISPMAGA